MLGGTQLNSDTGELSTLSLTTESDFYTEAATLPREIVTGATLSGVNTSSITGFGLSFEAEFEALFSNGVRANFMAQGWVHPNVGVSAEVFQGPGDIATALDFAVPLLPENWGLLTVVQQDLYFPDFDTFGYSTWFAYTTVPEPTTIVLVALGAAGVGYSRRRRA